MLNNWVTCPQQHQNWYQAWSKAVHQRRGIIVPRQSGPQEVQSQAVFNQNVAAKKDQSAAQGHGGRFSAPIPYDGHQIYAEHFEKISIITA